MANVMEPKMQDSSPVLEEMKPALTRRAWFAYGLSFVGLPLLANLDPLLQAQTSPPLDVATRSMLPIIGARMPEERLQNATELFGVILAISKELRDIDLGEIEPATVFTHK